jgi:hypothetical protein
MEFEAKYIDLSLHVPLLTAQHITAMFFLFFSIWCLPHFYGYIISMKEAAGHSGCLFQTNRSISRAAHQTILPSVYRLSIILHPLLWFTLDEQRPDFVILFLATWNCTTYVDCSDVFEQ